MQKVEILKGAILVHLKAANGNRKPDNFEGAFRSVMVAQEMTDKNRGRLEKLLNFSPFNFEAQLQILRRYKNEVFENKRRFLAYNYSLSHQFPCK